MLQLFYLFLFYLWLLEFLKSAAILLCFLIWGSVLLTDMFLIKEIMQFLKGRKDWNFGM